MAIGLNYSPLDTGNGTQILPNYMYCLESDLRADDGIFPVGAISAMRKKIEDGELLSFLKTESSNERFDDPLLRKILLEAYPYEITNKFMGGETPVNENRDKKIIALFDQFFDSNFATVVDEYAQRSLEFIEGLMHRSSVLHQEKYKDRNDAVEAYFGWFEALLKKQGFTKEAEALDEFRKKNMIVRYREGISGVTFSDEEMIIIEVGNDSYVTLFHEITHLVAKFFRYTYYENHEVCFDNYTKTNEGLSNYVAYHLFDGIMCGDEHCIESISHNELFFSPYIAVYALLRKKGSNKKSHNFALVKEFMEGYEGSMLTDEKAEFYFERFYKFFDYNQHTYFYPKELMYYIGYNKIRNTIKESSNPTQLLTQLLLGKVCL